jgi:proteic killer suppression protein
MRFVFRHKDLEKLWCSGKKPKGLSSDLVRAFQKAVRIIDSASTEQDIRAFMSLRMEKHHEGRHKGEYSVRLNDQFRLFIAIEKDDEGKFISIIEVSDPHQ